MDLVDKENVAALEVGNYRGEVAGALDRRSRRGAEIHSQFAGDDMSERGLA